MITKVNAILEDNAIDDDAKIDKLEELIDLYGWEKVEELLIEVLKEPGRSVEDYEAAAGVFWGACLDHRVIRNPNTIIALLYLRLPDDEDCGENNTAWSIVTELKKVDYFSKYDPLKDPDVIREYNLCIDAGMTPLEVPEPPTSETPKDSLEVEINKQDPNQGDVESPILEVIRAVGVLLLYGALFWGCTQIPLFLVAKLNPLAGLVAALIAIPLWLKLVKPMPGLVQGLICLAGFFSILAVNITCFIKVVKWLLS